MKQLKGNRVVFSRVLCFDLNRVNAITSLSFGLATPLVKANYDKDSHCISVVYSISHLQKSYEWIKNTFNKRFVFYWEKFRDKVMNHWKFTQANRVTEQRQKSAREEEGIISKIHIKHLKGIVDNWHLYPTQFCGLLQDLFTLTLFTCCLSIIKEKNISELAKR